MKSKRKTILTRRLTCIYVGGRYTADVMWDTDWGGRNSWRYAHTTWGFSEVRSKAGKKKVDLKYWNRCVPWDLTMWSRRNSWLNIWEFSLRCDLGPKKQFAVYETGTECVCCDLRGEAEERVDCLNVIIERSLWGTICCRGNSWRLEISVEFSVRYKGSRRSGCRYKLEDRPWAERNGPLARYWENVRDN